MGAVDTMEFVGGGAGDKEWQLARENVEKPADVADAGEFVRAGAGDTE